VENSETEITNIRRLTCEKKIKLPNQQGVVSGGVVG
jgi:hypothetical protein